MSERDFLDRPYSLSIDAARQIANTTKTLPMMGSLTPRWLLQFLPWIEVESGVFRVNHVRSELLKLSKNMSFLHEHNKTQNLTSENISKILFFSKLREEQIQKIMSLMTPQDFNPNTVIKGDEQFYILLSGRVEITLKDENARDSRLAILGHGDYFGDIGFDDNYRAEHNHTIKSLGKTKTMSVTRENFSKFLKSHPEIKEMIKQTIEENKKILQSFNAQGERIPTFMSSQEGHPLIPQGYFDYEEHPREYHLQLIQTTIRLHTRVGELYNSPHNQLQQQLKLCINAMKEKQEWELINHPHVGLLANVSNAMRVFTRTGSPTPDDMDDLISCVWKKPAFFIAHPAAISAFGRECTRRGVPPVAVNLHGYPFLTWRGIPIIPSDKLEIVKDQGTTHQVGITKILLIRVGLENQGIVGLTPAQVPPNPYIQEPGVTVNYNGVDDKSCANYLTSLYYSLASLTYDAVGVLEGVQVGNYYDYT